MKIGYPCINRSLTCKGNKTFRLKSYSEERLIATVENNLNCLLAILRYNVEHNLLFFRITSDLVPFASHPVCAFAWQEYFGTQLKTIGTFIKKHDIRISMHPDQFTLINSLDEDIFRRSESELLYHTQVLDLMGLDVSAKVQIHIGGVYNDKAKSIKRFVSRFNQLDATIKKRLVIENDHISYNFSDCLDVHERTNIPILLDVFHHSVNGVDVPLKDIFGLVRKTWKHKDGLPMVDYSSQRKGGTPGQHAESIDLPHFKQFIRSTREYDFDMMLEIKDKEKSALKAVRTLQDGGSPFFTGN